MRMPPIAVFCAVSLLNVASVAAHEALISPPPRDGMENAQKIVPCGDLPRSPNAYPVKPGDMLLMTWVETIHHPGWFRIEFRNSETGDFNQNVLMNNITSVDGVNDYSMKVQMPNIICDTCTVHLAFVMTDQPDPNHTFASGYLEYNACADLDLNPNAVTPPAGGTTTAGQGNTTTSTTTGGSSTGTTTGSGGFVDAPGPSGDATAPKATGGCAAAGADALLLLGTLGVAAALSGRKRRKSR